jgi:hypothetical protein
LVWEEFYADSVHHYSALWAKIMQLFFLLFLVKINQWLVLVSEIFSRGFRKRCTVGHLGFRILTQFSEKVSVSISGFFEDSQQLIFHFRRTKNLVSLKAILMESALKKVHQNRSSPSKLIKFYLQKNQNFHCVKKCQISNFCMGKIAKMDMTVKI